jgi:hypothetical protein
VLDWAASDSLTAEAVALVLVTGAAAAAYVWTKAPFYNPVDSIDPWLYTALWTNFDQIYHAFSTTYYVSRLPWIVPGYVVNLALDARTAYFVIHLVFFSTGAALLYFTCRRYFGRIAALCAYIGLIGNQLYFGAHHWDYEEGAVLTFLIASLAFAVPKRRTPGWRAASLALAGFFSAAVVTTRIVDIIYLVGLPLVYCAVMLDDRRTRLRSVARDLGAYAAGALVLLVGGGIFAKTHGAEFLFFMPQIRIVMSTSGEGNQVPVHLWFSTEPYFFVPIFAMALGCLVLAAGRPSTIPARRMLFAATAWTALTFTVIALWEFAGSGFVFELGYYFSSFLVPTIFCLAGCTAGLIDGAKPRALLRLAALGLAAVGVLAPLVWVYRSDALERAANGVFRGAYLTTLVFMAVALLLAGVVLVRRSLLACALAVGLTFLAASYGVDASRRTLQYSASDPRTAPLYGLGQETIGFLKANGFRRELPHFWYDDEDQGGIYRALQSLYYFSYTFLGIHLPVVDRDFRSRFAASRPSKLVLLCSEPTCKGGPAALARAGFSSKQLVRRRLASGGEHVWVVIRSIRPAT